MDRWGDVARMVIGRLEVPVGNDEDVVGKSATTIQGVDSSPFDDEVICSVIKKSP